MSKGEVAAIAKTYFGKHFVSYECPVCHDKLRSELRNAGQFESCPKCSQKIKVPGSEERKILEQEIDLPRPRQIQAAKLKNNSQLEVHENRLLKKVESTKIEQQLSTIQIAKEFENEYVEKFLRLCDSERDAKFDILFALGNELKLRILDVRNRPWPQDVKRKAVRELKEIQRKANAEIMEN